MQLNAPMLTVTEPYSRWITGLQQTGALLAAHNRHAHESWHVVMLAWPCTAAGVLLV
jgi:hypothetical protein